MKASIDMRVSIEGQRERQPIATQGERCCALHEIPVAGSHAGNGVTGPLPLEQRPEGACLLEDAKGKKFDAVLLCELDRLGRVPRLILSAVKEVEDLGAEVRSMSRPFDTSSPAGRFLLTILPGDARLERENTNQRSVEGTNRLARGRMQSPRQPVRMVRILRGPLDRDSAGELPTTLGCAEEAKYASEVATILAGESQKLASHETTTTQ